jgi:hypothetical protein
MLIFLEIKNGFQQKIKPMPAKLNNGRAFTDQRGRGKGKSNVAGIHERNN